MAQKKTQNNRQSKKTITKKATTKPPKSTQANPLNIYLKQTIRFFSNEKVKFMLALGMVLFAIFLLFAFISYLFTWQNDQSEISKEWFLFNPDIHVNNWAGKLGAALAHLFITKWFGLPSFALLFICILWAFRLIRIELLPFKRSLLYALIGMIWFSVFLSYVFGNDYFSLGGAHGYYLSRWLNSALGKVGTGFFLLIALLTFIIVAFDKSFQWTKALFLGKRSIAKSDANVSGVRPEEPLLTEDDHLHKTVEGKSNADEKQSVIKKEFILREDGSEETLDDLGFEVQNTIKKKEEQAKIESEKSRIPETVNAIEKKGRHHIDFEDVEMTSSRPEGDDKQENSQDQQLKFKVEKNEDVQSDEQMMQENYDPTLELSNYQLPGIDLLDDHSRGDSEVTSEELLRNKNKIVETLKNYKIEIVKIKATIGPTITLYEIIPAPGVRISKIKNLEDDIALSLAAFGIRIIAPMPGRGTIGIEVPNENPETVSMKSVLAAKRFQETHHELPIALGKTISNETYVVDLTKMPHLLVAGATGQGKSVGLNAIIASLLYKKHPAQVKFVLVDPKKVELTLYERIERHFLAKLPDSPEAIITENQKVIQTLTSLNIEMDNRYQLLKKAHVRNIKEYNVKFTNRRLNPEKGHRYLPYLVLVIDEFADLIMTAGKEIELPIARIAQLARAVGIHLIVATQRPSTNIITGVIKANFPTRIAFKVASMIDSRTILDSPGANQLIGRGDMLITQGSDLIRLQCAFIDTPEIERITNFIGDQRGYLTAHVLPDYTKDEEDDSAFNVADRDDLFEEAARLVVLHQQGSASLIQRKLSIGYNRAGRIIDQLEAAGIVGQHEGSKARQVLYQDEYSLDQFLSSLNNN